MIPDSTPVNIYCLVDPITLRVRYIGRTKLSIQNRLYAHIQQAKNSKKYNKNSRHLYNWINKVLSKGQSPVVRKLTSVIGWQHSHLIERQLISKYRDRLVNSDDRGEGGLNKKISDAAKLQISATLKKRYACLEIQKQNTTDIYVYDIHGCYIDWFSTITECSKVLGMSSSSIVKVASGIHKQCKGYQFSYIYAPNLSNLRKKYKHVTSVTLLDALTEQEFVFKSLQECADFLGIDKQISTRTLVMYGCRAHGKKYRYFFNGVEAGYIPSSQIKIHLVVPDKQIDVWFESAGACAMYLGTSLKQAYKSYLKKKVNQVFGEDAIITFNQ